VAVALVSFGASRAVRAQIQVPSTLQSPLGIQNLNQQSAVPLPPQPIEVRNLDTQHFVVVTREPRLVAKVTGQGPVQNMLVTVVVHYTVSGEHLIPLEHVRLPAGYKLVTLEE
jgi:hypothetical protein